MGTGVGQLDNHQIGRVMGTFSGTLDGTANGLLTGDFLYKTNAQTFISVWNTALNTTGGSGVGNIRLPLVSTGKYNFFVDWGDNTPIQKIQAFNSPLVTHNYLRGGIYTIKITGTIIGWQFNNTGDRNKLLTIKQWGSLRLDNGASLNSFFSGCDNLSLTGTTDVLKLDGVISMAFFLADQISVVTSALTSVNRINEWDTSNITDMSVAFQYLETFDDNLNSWNTSNVTSTSYMFLGDVLFNSPLSGWDVSNVTNMNSMFTSAQAFNQNINNWNVSKVTNMGSMLYQTSSFNQPLSDWNTSACTDMGGMLAYTTVFNQDINNWDVSKVTNMSVMFQNARAFNSPLSGWNTSACTGMVSMFNNASAFNNGLPSGTQGTLAWNTSNVNSMVFMFNGATGFNQDISSWDVRKVTDMNSMFLNATLFNQPIDGWAPSSATNMTSMFENASDFNQPFTNFNSSACTNMDSMFQGAVSFNSTVSGMNTSKVTNMNSMFQVAVSYNQPMSGFNTSSVTAMTSMFNIAQVFNQDINSWNVSKVTNTSGMFQDATAFNSPLSGWNTSACTNMNSMFRAASNFNQNINNWDVRKVTTMSNMFQDAIAFNQPITGWNPTACTQMTGMFQGATNFNQNLNSLNVSKVTQMINMFLNAPSFNNGLPSGTTGIFNWNNSGNTSMSSMFTNASAFSQNINSWDVSRVTVMSSAFSRAVVFNSPLSGWNMSAVTSMSAMFNGATNFNQPIGNWNLPNLTDTAVMFQDAINFNQPLSAWNVSKVTSMGSMFRNAIAFNQNIGNWNVSACTSLGQFMQGKSDTNYSPANLDAIYNGWIRNELVPANTGINFENIKYTNAGVEGRALLTRANTSRAITAIANIGGQFAVTTAVHGLVTGNKVFVKGGSTYPTATGLWTVSAASTTQLVLSGSVFAGSYVAGGTMRSGYAWGLTDGGATGITSGMVASYTLDNVLVDVVGLAPTGTLTGVDYVLGKTGNAARFNATTDRIDIADTTLLSFTDGVNDSAFTVSLWVYFTAFSTDGNILIMKRGGTSGTDEWQVNYNVLAGGYAQFFKIDKANNGVIQGIGSPVNPFLLNTWYNLTVTDNGTKTEAGMKIYINGVLQTPTSTSGGVYTGMPNGTSITRMGQASFGALIANNAHQGYLEDISIWKGRALSQTDITQLYNSGNGNRYPFV